MVYELVADRFGSTRQRAAVTLLVLLVLFAWPPAAAAERRQFGGKAGPAFTGIALSDDDGQQYHARIAAALAGFLVLPLTPRLAVQLEALSSPKGTRLEEEGANLRQTLKLRYFEVPLLARISGPKMGPGVWHFFAGPSFGIRISAKQQISMLVNSMVAGVEEDARDRVERFETGLIVGAGIDIGRRLLVEGRYSHGLTNVNRVAGATHFTNRGLSFTTGVRF
jgi:hypothetical protein